MLVTFLKVKHNSFVVRILRIFLNKFILFLSIRIIRFNRNIQLNKANMTFQKIIYIEKCHFDIFIKILYMKDKYKDKINLRKEMRYFFLFINKKKKN